MYNFLMQNKNIDFLKRAIKFRRKPAKMGKRYVFNIPSNYIENGLIDPNEHYMIYLAKIEEANGKDELG